MECFWENGGWRRPGEEGRLQFLLWTSADDRDDDDYDDGDDDGDVLWTSADDGDVLWTSADNGDVSINDDHDAVYIQYSRGNCNHSIPLVNMCWFMMVMFTMMMVVVSVDGVQLFTSSPWYSRGRLQFLLVVASHILLLEIGKK